jgi:hypothetical protein
MFHFQRRHTEKKFAFDKTKKKKAGLRTKHLTSCWTGQDYHDDMLIDRSSDMPNESTAVTQAGMQGRK